MRHPFHLVERSPWPILTSLNILFFLIGLVSYMTGYKNGFLLMKIGLIMILYLIYLWFKDIISESLYLGFNSYPVLHGFILGFIYFIITEIMLFFSLFWAYFHSALNPTGYIWPPIGIDLINPWSIPLLNTLLLLYSGVAVTYAHHSYLNNKRNIALNWLAISILLGFCFFLLQLFEYLYSSFDISDSVYSSSFYLLTGCHGLHIIFGLSFLIMIYIRVRSYSILSILFDLGVLYYHLVDIIWIILFILIYYMGY